MGPKRKKDDKKGKDKGSAIDPNEVVTELMKEFFEVQLEDIEKKVAKLTNKQEELKMGKIELKEKMEEFRKEKGAVITEHEQILALKEEEKMQKREEMNNLSVEIRTRIANHEKHVVELQEKFDKMVEDITKEVEELEKDVHTLEDFKYGKDRYMNELEQLEKQMEEAEIQHQRNLFSIKRKCEMVKVSVKKDLEQRLIQLSIEFQETSKQMIGNSCHRVSQENKVIENELQLMSKELEEYQEKLKDSTAKVEFFKKETKKREFEKDKAIARTLIQVVIIKNLMKDRDTLLEKLNEFANIEAENKALLRRKKNIAIDIEVKAYQIEEIKKTIEDKIQEINYMKEVMKHLKKSAIKLQVIIRKALKVAEEALAIHLIPMGGTDEEKFMTSEAKIMLFKKRRDSVFAKKGKNLQALLDIFSRAQLKEEDKKLLSGSSLSINLDSIHFSEIFGKPGSAEEKEEPDMLPRKTMSSESLGSDVSLPRSVSDIQVAAKESIEGEFDEHEEFEGEHTEVEGVVEEGMEKEKVEEYVVKEKTEEEIVPEQEAEETVAEDVKSLKEGQGDAEEPTT